MIKKIAFTTIVFVLTIPGIKAQTGAVEGVVTDRKTGETIIGATVLLESLTKGTATDPDGKFRIEGIPAGKYTLKISCISYQTVELEDVIATSGETTSLRIALDESATALKEVTVSGTRKMNTEAAILSAQRAALSVVSGVSSRQIARTQDRDAAEVIKRIPGISIIDDKFVISRGLAQRYNNVWINNSAVPSSEADSRSFSFDIIPSSQIENIMIVKSPSPELPADFSGGFIKIQTTNMPSENSFQLNYGMNFNTETLFRDFKYNRGAPTDLLGFDNSRRTLKSVVPHRLDNTRAEQVDRVTKQGFNNDWTIHTGQPLPDQRLSAAFNRKFDFESGSRLGLIAAFNYNYTTRTYADMANSRYGVYDSRNDKPVYLYKYTDNVYAGDVKLGALLNITYLPNAGSRLELRNIFNRLGRNRYTERQGYQYISGLYNQEKQEYLYSSRMAYCGQLAGNHTLTGGVDKIDWTMGFSYSNNNRPDRRIIEREENGFVGDPYYGRMHVDQNEIYRDFINLDEYIYSSALNYSRDLSFAADNIKPIFRSGIYGEYRTRRYDTRTFFYRWKEGAFAGDFAYRNVVDSILITDNYGADRLYAYEDTDNRDSYKGADLLGAGYLSLSLPLGKFNLHAGARVEYNQMKLTNYTTIKETKTKETTYAGCDVFPSINATFNFDKTQLLRLAYGSSINRQEFREVSSSVYYDFDLFSAVMGNPNLKPAKIQNFDVRYERYPSPNELISLAFFYKHFKNPIEWTFLDAGGSYTYTFENAEKANNFGLELDVKKSLDFIGMNHFSFLFNGSLINSNVIFGKNSQEHDRPMQGQSPYIVNTGLFYQNDRRQVNMALLYNRIGKRIVGIGKVDASEGGSISNDVPDMYEMPRNVLDLSISKKCSKRIELSLSVRDILAQKIVFKQFPRFYDNDDNLQTREQTTKEYKPGQNIALTMKVNF